MSQRPCLRHISLRDPLLARDALVNHQLAAGEVPMPVRVIQPPASASRKPEVRLTRRDRAARKAFSSNHSSTFFRARVIPV